MYIEFLSNGIHYNPDRVRYIDTEEYWMVLLENIEMTEVIKYVIDIYNVVLKTTRANNIPTDTYWQDVMERFRQLIDENEELSSHPQLDELHQQLCFVLQIDPNE
jgi:hypothetical protein